MNAPAAANALETAALDDVAGALALPTAPDDLLMVACFQTKGLRLAYPLNRRDVEADIRWARRFLSSVGVVAGDTVAVSAACSELGHFWPYECAIEALDACVAMAENVSFDARRTEMFLRRFEVRAAFGISDEILNGLEMADLPLYKTFASTPLVFARDAAAERLRKAGLDPWRMVTLGPLFAFVSPRGEVHYDEEEWLLESIGGEVHVSARQPRAKPLFRLPVGVAGQAPAGEHGWRFA